MATVLLANSVDFSIAELDQVFTTLADHAQEATYLIGAGIVPSFPEGSRDRGADL